MHNMIALHAGQVGRWGILVVALGLGACTTTDYPPAPRLAATPDYNYIIGPGDTVNIIVWRNPELSMSVPVRPDGKISTPLVEDLAALGKIRRRWRATSRRRSASTFATRSSP